VKDALIIVDYQNDFVKPLGALYVQGAEDLADGINKLAELYPIVVLTQDWHAYTDPSFTPQGGQWPIHCVAETYGAQLSANIARASELAMLVLRKRQNSAFMEDDEHTGLAGYLRGQGADRVHICGVALEFCIKETAIDAQKIGFDTTVIVRATRAVTHEGQVMALTEFKQRGVRQL